MGESQSKEMGEDDALLETGSQGAEEVDSDSQLDEEEEDEFMDAEDGSDLEFLEGTATDSRPSTSRSISPSEQVPASLCVNYDEDNKSRFPGEESPERPRESSIADLRDFDCCEYRTISPGQSKACGISFGNGRSNRGEYSEHEDRSAGGETRPGSGSPDSEGHSGESVDSERKTPLMDQINNVTHVLDLSIPLSFGSPSRGEAQSSPSRRSPGRPRGSTKSELPKHIKVSQGQFGFPIYECACGKAFTTRANVNYHKNCDGSEKEFQCPDCPRRFSVRSHCAVHIKNVHQPPTLPCPICKRLFRRKSRLLTHLRQHNGERPFRCSDCDLTFTSNENLQGHLSHVHSPSSEGFKCDQCDKTYRTKRNLRLHLKIHTEGIRHQCGKCLRMYKYKNSLMVHIAECHPPTEVDPVTQEERPIVKFQCGREGCGKVFVSERRLDSHEREHVAAGGGVNPYTCKVCRREYSRRDNLERHTRKVHPPVAAPPTPPTTLSESNPEIPDNPVEIEIIEIN